MLLVQDFDHTFGNMSILLYLDSLYKKGTIIDDCSEMEIVSNEPVYICNQYAFFSMMNIFGIAKGITIENAKNADITCEYRYDVSNEVTSGNNAKVTVKCGKLFLIKNRV